MAGWLVCISSSPNTAQAAFDSNMRHLHRDPMQVCRVYKAAHFVAGLVLPAPVLPELWCENLPRSFVGVHGEYYSNDRVVENSEQEAKRILDAAIRSDMTYLVDQNGLYNTVAWDGTRQTCWIASDRIGALLLFVRVTQDLVEVCSEPGVLEGPCSNLHPNKRGISSLLGLGYQASDDTISEDVKVLPPSSVHTVTVSDSKVQLENFHVPAQCDPCIRERDLHELYFDSVRLRVRNDRPVCLPLTGGEDSRFLAALLYRIGIRPAAYTLDGAQSKDAPVASRVACELKLLHQKFDIESDALASRSKKLQFALGGTSDWHFAVYLPLLEAIPAGATIPLGYLGGTLSGAGVMQKSDDQKWIRGASAPYWYRLSGSTDAVQPGITLSYRPTIPIWSGVQAPRELLLNLYGRQRRYTSALLRLAWNYGRPVCPFADRRLLHWALSCSRSQLRGQSARRRVMRRILGSLGKLPSSNDGLPVNSIFKRAIRYRLQGTPISRLFRTLIPTLKRTYDIDRLAPVVEKAIRTCDQDPLGSLVADYSILGGFALLAVPHNQAYTMAVCEMLCGPSSAVTI